MLFQPVKEKRLGGCFYLHLLNTGFLVLLLLLKYVFILEQLGNLVSIILVKHNLTRLGMLMKCSEFD